MKLHVVRATLAALALAALPLTVAWAQIERLTLAQMVQRADNCVAGRIVSSEVFRVDHPIDGPELYFTTLRVEGKSLYTGADLSVPVTFAGGVMPDGQGVWNSEAPSADDTALGNEVVVFYKWTDNMGGDVAANALYAAHGGLYRVMTGRKAKVVLGRGKGYAVDANTKLADLTSAIAKLR